MVPGDDSGAQPAHPQQPQPPPAPPAPSAPPRPAEPPLRPVRSASKARPVSSGQQGRPVRSQLSALKGPHGQSVTSAKSARSSKARTGSRAPSLHHPSATSKEDLKKRAEERAKVPDRFRDSLKRFFFSPTGVLKILRLGLEIGALACFIIAQAHESYVAITVLEICIVIFFILIYMITLHHLLTYLHWPLLDLINSFITAVFLLTVAILAMQERKRRHLFVGGNKIPVTTPSLTCTEDVKIFIPTPILQIATIVCLLDAFVVTKTMRTNVKSFLAVGLKTTPSPEDASFGAHQQMHVSLPPDIHEGPPMSADAVTHSAHV